MEENTKKLIRNICTGVIIVAGGIMIVLGSATEAVNSAAGLAIGLGIAIAAVVERVTG